MKTIREILSMMSWTWVPLVVVTGLGLALLYLVTVTLAGSKLDGTQTSGVQLVQRIMLVTVILVGAVCVWLFDKYPGGPLNGPLLGFCIVIAAILVVAWGINAWPIQDQIIPILLKLGAFTLLGILAVRGIMGAWEFLGGKILPHALGVTLKGAFFHDSKVLLPGMILLASVFVIIASLWVLLTSLQDANWGDSIVYWLIPAPLAVLSGFVLLIVVGAWATYFNAVSACQKNRGILTAADAASSIKPRSEYVRLAEYYLGTREWNHPTFHRLAEDPYSLGLSQPGFLVGIEKAGRHLIGASEMIKEADTNASRGGIRKLLSDRKLTVLTHIVEFSPPQSGAPGSGPRDSGKGPRFHFNLYGSKHDPLACKPDSVFAWNQPKEAYSAGFTALDNLGKALKDRVKPTGSAYTHILLLCMGWNTDQQEAIRNYNSIMGHLMAAVPKTGKPDSSDTGSVPFNPLVIGLSWPSEWALLAPASYPAKAEDADETGMIWGSYLLKKVLAPLKQVNPKLKLVLIGHSFGVRLLTRAMASNPDWIKPANGTTDQGPSGLLNSPDVDLMIGLQGAFSIDRFVDRGPITGGGLEGAPYKHLLEAKTRFVFTWSKEDKANPLAAMVTGANHIGGSYGAALAADHPRMFTAVTYPNAALGNLEDKKIRMVDMSAVVKDATYGKGGKAHSDIYKAEIGQFIWKTIESLPETESAL